MVLFLLLLTMGVAIVLGSQISKLNARFMRLEPHLEAMLQRIAALESALKAAKSLPKAPDEPTNDADYHNRWRAAAASTEPHIASESTAPPMPEPEMPAATVEPMADMIEPVDLQPEPVSEPEAAFAAASPSSADPAQPLPAKARLSFEELIGGKLPIWVGGIALVIASFFLVGYAIENGMLNRQVQVILAALFGSALLIASEAARRIPKLADDARVAQSLAGAGIASLYGTLYVASEAYRLVSPTTSFTLMACVTAIALFLSLRNGPPTAIMGLIGGFVAPFSATPTGNLVPLLVYLGLLISGLFAVSLNRGWRWLAIAATGGGVIWSMGLMLTGAAGINASLGLFIVILTIGAMMLIPRFGMPNLRDRALPMLAGFVQLAIFAHHIQFDLSGWMLYGLLSAAALYLGWRDAKLMPATLAALGLVLILLIGGFEQGNPIVPWAAIGTVLLFSIPGHALARRPLTDWYWTALAIGGGVAPFLIAHYWAPSQLLSTNQWGWLFAVAALPQAWLSWRARAGGRTKGLPDWALFGGGAAAGLMALYAVINWLAGDWQASGIMLIALGMSAWARHTVDRSLSAASLGYWAIGMLFWLFAFVSDGQLLAAIFSAGDTPDVSALLALLITPAGLVFGIAWLNKGLLPTEPLRWVGLALALGLPPALTPFEWQPAVLALITAATLATEHRLPLPRYAVVAMAIVTGLYLIWPLSPFLEILAGSIVGQTQHYALLNPMMTVAQMLGLPAAIFAASLWRYPDRFVGRSGLPVKAITAVTAVAALYAFAKQPLAIATDAMFESYGFVERAVLTQILFVTAIVGLWRGSAGLRRAAWGLLALALLRFGWFDLVLLNPVFVKQNVGAVPMLNAAVLHYGVTAFWLWLAVGLTTHRRIASLLRYASLFTVLVTVGMAVRQFVQGPFLNAHSISEAEQYGYSLAYLVLAIIWLWRGIVAQARWQRVTALLLLTVVTVKVFVYDASKLEGLLRIFSFMGLGIALIAIGWAYNRFVSAKAERVTEP